MDKGNVFAVTVVVSLDENISEFPLINVVVDERELLGAILAKSNVLRREFNSSSGMSLKSIKITIFMSLSYRQTNFLNP